jgi:hypothetical protein
MTRLILTLAHILSCLPLQPRGVEKGDEASWGPETTNVLEEMSCSQPAFYDPHYRLFSYFPALLLNRM